LLCGRIGKQETTPFRRSRLSEGFGRDDTFAEVDGAFAVRRR
jgi:hypothetical protein